jgi:hypothetical protein
MLFPLCIGLLAGACAAFVVSRIARAALRRQQRLLIMQRREDFMSAVYSPQAAPLQTAPAPKHPTDAKRYKVF